MRTALHPGIERCRITEGKFASAPGAGAGAFLVASTKGGGRLMILAWSGSGWEACGLDGPAREHVSVHVPKGPDGAGRTPSWEERCFVKRHFFQDDEAVVQYHPDEANYVNVHQTTLHLWRCRAGFPMPPKVCV